MTSVEPSWPPPVSDLVLRQNEVHVWRIALDQPMSLLQIPRQTLAADELSRAKRYHFQRDRDHFIIGRGALRAILGRYLTTPPEQICFQYSQYGKPNLVTARNQTSINFNLSHSGNLALLACSQDREVGVDLEQLRPMPDAPNIAKRFFSKNENETFLKVPPDKRVEAFFNCWTRKEAYIKAIGEGLSHPLDTFDVSLKPGEAPKLLAVRDNPAEIERWRLLAFKPAPGYVGALISEGQDWQPKFWQWSPEK